LCNKDVYFLNHILKSYRSSFLLLSSIIIGGIAGITFGKDTAIVKPFGDLFLNLMFMLLVPLVFFSISSAIANMNGMNRLGKIIGSIFLVFFTTAFIMAILGFIGVSIVNPLKGVDLTSIKHIMSHPDNTKIEQMTILERLVNTVTVTDFSLLLSRANMLQLIVFSILLGISTSLVGEKGKPFAIFLSSGTEVIMKMVSIIMYYAPIGLGCYFANVI